MLEKRSHFGNANNAALTTLMSSSFKLFNKKSTFCIIKIEFARMMYVNEQNRKLTLDIPSLVNIMYWI